VSGGQVRRPTMDRSQRCGREFVPAVPAAHLRSHQTRVLQHLQVLRDGGPAHRQELRELTGGGRPVSEPLQKDPAGTVGDGDDRGVEIGFHW
jgi:hypothetical protein